MTTKAPRDLGYKLDEKQSFYPGFKSYNITCRDSAMVFNMFGNRDNSSMATFTELEKYFIDVMSTVAATTCTMTGHSKFKAYKVHSLGTLTISTIRGKQVAMLLTGSKLYASEIEMCPKFGHLTANLRLVGSNVTDKWLSDYNQADNQKHRPAAKTSKLAPMSKEEENELADKYAATKLKGNR